MSSRPPSPRSLRSLRGRCVPTLRGSSGFTGNVGHDNDELMTINENRNVGGGGGSGSAGGNEASDGNESESSHANSSISVSSVSSTSSSASSTTSSTSGSEGAPSDPSSLLHGESGRHPMDASSSCNACSSLVLDNNHPFPHEHDRPLMNGCEDMWSWNKRDRSKEVWLSRSDNRRVYFHPNWSKGTAGIRGTRVLNNGRYYWEISLTQRVFGTR
ncbi:AGAP009203-PA-like protein [Anopheles sinensis]|uniref:AGAP009203-PA-like protein n=1 Tax=Anopheles sinensis TaxID=74873 RepID=A0A084WQP0_ANOSI|nr:AGAP009203-PA-like protein [Anopheles sinensis]